MNINDEYNVAIEKITNLGFGLARINGIVVFIENVCPGDKARIKITKLSKNFANAKVIEIIGPSCHRSKGFCAMQNVCGSCQLQFIEYNYQLKIKQEIVKDAINSIAGIDINIPEPVKSPETLNYRRKIQYPISQTKNSKRILAGYYKKQSHEIVNIKYCPIQPVICDKIIDYIRENAKKYNISGYNEKAHNGLVKHVIIRNSSYNEENLVSLVLNAENIDNNIKNFCESIYNNFQEVTGVCVNFNPKKTNVILGDKNICVIGKGHITEKIIDKYFRIGTEAFFQVNPKSAENIFKYVKNYIKTNFKSPGLLDAYAGISAFGIVLSDVCKSVVSIEENEKSVELAKISAKENNVKNIEINCGDASEFLENENRKFDIIVLDPPRKGCTAESLDRVVKLCKDTIIYVSCNPATLARDLKYLVDKGAKIESVQPFDMFCHTYHIENVAIIKVS